MSALKSQGSYELSLKHEPPDLCVSGFQSRVHALQVLCKNNPLEFKNEVSEFLYWKKKKNPKTRELSFSNI